MASKLPLIGITGRRTPVDKPFPLVESIAIQETFVSAVERGGGLGCILASKSLTDEEADSVVHSLDGLVLTGGLDVDPAIYGQDPHPQISQIDRTQDDFEIALALAALRNAVPILCICRGLQILNIAKGGTLEQHITDKPGLGKHGVPLGGGGHVNEIIIDEGSTLFDTLGPTAHGECHHHQAVDVVGDGLKVVARTADGVVEGLEPVDYDGWIIAIQWHPEDTAADDQQQQHLFDTLVGEARKSAT